MTDPLNITLAEALQRVLDSTATNEGPDAQLSFVDAQGDRQTRTVREFLESGATGMDTAVCLTRTQRNWTIVFASTGAEIVRSHPWDDTPNVAFMGSRPDAEQVKSFTDYLNRLESLANESERIRLFQFAMAQWGMAVSLRDALKMPAENARAEARRLAGLVQLAQKGSVEQAGGRRGLGGS